MIGQTISNYRVVEKFGVSLNYVKFLQRNAQRYKLAAQKLIAHKEGAYFTFTILVDATLQGTASALPWPRWCKQICCYLTNPSLRSLVCTDITTEPNELRQASVSGSLTVVG